MPPIRNALLAVLITTATTPATAGDLRDGWDWLAGTRQVETQGAVWNDRFGDGKDRWKTGGITQSYVLPEGVFGDDAWFDGRAPALELNMRALVIIPDNTSYMRENSLRAGGDIFIGSALEARTWGKHLSTGAVVAGASKPRPGFNWTGFLGGDVGYVTSDAFLDGGFLARGPEMDRRDIVARARAGILLEYGRLGVGFSLNWLGREFEAQPEGQLIGAVQLKNRF